MITNHKGLTLRSDPLWARTSHKSTGETRHAGQQGKPRLAECVKRMGAPVYAGASFLFSYVSGLQVDDTEQIVGGCWQGYFGSRSFEVSAAIIRSIVPNGYSAAERRLRAKSAVRIHSSGQARSRWRGTVELRRNRRRLRDRGAARCRWRLWRGRSRPKWERLVDRSFVFRELIAAGSKTCNETADRDEAVTLSTCLC